MNKTIIFPIITVVVCSLAISGCLEGPTNNNPSNNNSGISLDNAILVDNDGGKNFSKIQNAINFASDNSTIFVYEGVYNEKLTLNKSIKLIGENRNETILNCDGLNLASQTGLVNINAENCTVSNFKIVNPGEDSDLRAINVSSSYNNISNNIISNSNYGIYIETSSHYNNISQNKIFYNGYGVYVDSQAKYNNISLNNISSNIEYGIYMKGWVKARNMVYGNTVFNNEGYGIRIKGSKNNTVTKNLISKNEYGLLFCCGAENNLVYLNSFKGNSVYNARDYIKNSWDNGYFGNYWKSFHNESQGAFDENNDGIIDIPYNISGGDNKDRYPLATPPEII